VKKYFVLSIVMLLVLPSSGQPLKMRSRLLTSLTNIEIEQYLQRNDVIFIPVGPTEVHGGLPVDCEYVGPLAVAIKMAEKADGLVLPHLAFSYPGGTTVGRGTIYVSSSDYLAYLKLIAHSLLRQGFKTQIYVTGHGGSYLETAPLVREFLDETKVPILAIDLNTARANYGSKGSGRSESFLFGAYSIVGRLDDIPLDFSGIDIPNETEVDIPESVFDFPKIKGLDRNKLNQHMALGFYYSSPFQHGGIPKSMTAAERDKIAKEGVKAIDELIDSMDVKAIIDGLKWHRQWIKDNVLPKYGNLLDFTAKH
jgi:creatinine amidohydrolase